MLTLRKGMGALRLCALILISIMIVPQVNAQTTTKVIKNWIDWNGVFDEKTDAQKRQVELEKLKGEIAALSAKPVDGVKSYKGKLTSYLKKAAKKKGIKPNQIIIRNILVTYCSCQDSILWNIRADAEVNPINDSTGDSKSAVVPPTPKTRPAGEPISILENNDEITFDQDKNPPHPLSQILLRKRPATISEKAVIAVLDTGIDTAYLEEGLRTEVLWHGASGSRNMKVDGDPLNYMDDDTSKHGTSVASLAMNSFYQTSDNSQMPQLMILKVLDKHERGTVFELCCGLCYAVENRATVINISLGYYGFNTDILDHYIRKCHEDSIPIVAAAGNSDDPTIPNLVCSPNIRNQNRLNLPGRFFVPGSLAMNTEMYTVISVNGMSAPGMPCYFQNFSKEYVTLGVVNRTTETRCCEYQLPFIDPTTPLRGSSFATPIVSGRLAYDISSLGHFTSITNYLRMMNVATSPLAPGTTESVTQKNQYITY